MFILMIPFKMNVRLEPVEPNNPSNIALQHIIIINHLMRNFALSPRRHGTSTFLPTQETSRINSRIVEPIRNTTRIFTSS